MEIDELRKKAEDSTKRGKPIKFADGNTWVIPTMPLKLSGHRINELSDKAMGGTISTEESIELIAEIVKLNYPDAHDDDINPDLESMHEVITQYTGRNLGK